MRFSARRWCPRGRREMARGDRRDLNSQVSTLCCRPCMRARADPTNRRSVVALVLTAALSAAEVTNPSENMASKSPSVAKNSAAAGTSSWTPTGGRTIGVRETHSSSYLIFLFVPLARGRYRCLYCTMHRAMTTTHASYARSQ